MITFRDLTSDTPEPIVFEGHQIAEFADLMARIPFLSGLTREQVAGIRRAVRITGVRNGTGLGRDWSYDFGDPHAEIQTCPMEHGIRVVG